MHQAKMHSVIRHGWHASGKVKWSYLDPLDPCCNVRAISPCRLRLEETERKLSEMERKLAGSRVRSMELQKELSALQQGGFPSGGAAWAAWSSGAQITGGAITPLHGPLSAGAAGRHESQV
jgi:hypothetical protein